MPPFAILKLFLILGVCGYLFHIKLEQVIKGGGLNRLGQQYGPFHNNNKQERGVVGRRPVVRNFTPRRWNLLSLSFSNEAGHKLNPYLGTEGPLFLFQVQRRGWFRALKTTPQTTSFSLFNNWLSLDYNQTADQKIEVHTVNLLIF